MLAMFMTSVIDLIKMAALVDEFSPLSNVEFQQTYAVIALKKFFTD